MDDQEIIALFWDRNEQAIRETEQKYGRLCMQLAGNILRRREDAEECVSDTWMRLWNAIPDDRPVHFTAYICQITRRLALNRLRHDRAAGRSGETAAFEELSGIVSDADDTEAALDVKELSRAVSSFLRKQDETDRYIFLRRCWFCDPVEVIAQHLGMNRRTVATRLFRTRKRLQAYLEKEGFLS